jgi:UDP-2,3-diacylglucosamine pyrophosphatase LpxH
VHVRPDAAVKATASRRRCHGDSVRTHLSRHYASRRRCQGDSVQTQLSRHQASRRNCHGDSVRTHLSRHHASRRKVSRRLRPVATVTAPGVQTQLSRRLRPDATVTVPRVQTQGVKATPCRRSYRGTKHRDEIFIRISILGRRQLAVVRIVTQSSSILYIEHTAI